MIARGPDEADTCRDFVLPAIAKAGWRTDQVHAQHPVLGDNARPEHKRYADYVLTLVPDLPMVVIEAKRLWSHPEQGLQQATRYARKLDVPFALSTNGRGWILYNDVTGTQQQVDDIPTPEEAWDLFTSSHGVEQEAKEYLRGSFSTEARNVDGSVRQLRYYQRRAIHKVLIAKAAGRRRILLVMATGSGKTFTAVQLVWKLVNHRRLLQRANPALPNFRVLYLADRDHLVGDPLGNHFRPVFKEAVTRVSSKDVRLSPDIYFSTYQALDRNDPDTGESRELLYNYPPDFFDLVIVDECHRGSARADSSWRGILDHFSSAVQLGLTATPVARNGADTYEYFDNPVDTYSLRDGIDDGFLAPYTIRRVVFDVDADGLTIADGRRDIHGQLIPAGEYGTRDYERRLRLPDRTHAMARRILDVIGDKKDRAVIFCVDSAHALTMCGHLRNLRPDRTRTNPEWVSRIMHDEREKDRLLAEFTDPTASIPQIAVTSSLLSTGIDIVDLRYVILCRTVGSLSEFKQIIGRGSRLYDDGDTQKTEFEIIDFVGATEHFRDPEFDGPPLKPPSVEKVDMEGEIEETSTGEVEVTDPESVITVAEPDAPFTPGGSSDGEVPASEHTPREVFELRGVPVTLTSEGFYVHDVETGRPRLVRFVDWARERILERFATADDLLAAWSRPADRTSVLNFLRGNRIDPARLVEELGEQSGEAVDTVDRLLHLAYDLPTLTRAERARRARSSHRHQLDEFSEKARAVLDLLLDRYSEEGIDEVASDNVITVPPLSDLGTPREITATFGGPKAWHEARERLQEWLYSA